jgi:hypothetical protein
MGSGWTTVLRCGACLALLGALDARAQTPALRSFDALYEVRYKGIFGGTMQFSLRAGPAADQYVYSVDANPNWLGRLKVSADARQSSQMRIDDGHVLPQHYQAEDGRRSTDEDSDLRFDWSRHRLTGTAKSSAIDEPIDIGWHDYLSAQVAILLALSKGEALGTLHVMDEKKVRAFRYSQEGKDRRVFQGKEVEVLVIRSDGVDDASLRINRYWHAPELSFLPIAVERSRKGKVDLSLRLVELKFLD